MHITRVSQVQWPLGAGAGWGLCAGEGWGLGAGAGWGLCAGEGWGLGAGAGWGLCSSFLGSGLCFCRQKLEAHAKQWPNSAAAAAAAVV